MIFLSAFIYVNLWFSFWRKNKIMCCKKFWKKFVPFALTFALGLLTANLLPKENPAKFSPTNVKPPSRTVYVGDGTRPGRGSAACGDYRETESDADGKLVNPVRSELTSLKILAKPRANYTDAARANQVQGTVRVRVTFLANGEIGSISPVSSLPDGLTEQAIAAARQIKFEPAKRAGIPMSVTKVVEYTFTIY
jgi:TonB family protein